jgi:hypothetical protein
MRYLLPLFIAAMLLLTSCVQVVLEFNAPSPQDRHPVCSGSAPECWPMYIGPRPI